MREGLNVELMLTNVNSFLEVQQLTTLIIACTVLVSKTRMLLTTHIFIV